MQVIDVVQGSEEWFKIKLGKMSASHAQAIGNNGKGLESYIYSLCAEFLSKNKEIYVNEDTLRGLYFEREARNIYEISTGVSVQQVGFCQLDEHTGCSPDGLIGQDGLIEIKCPKGQVYLKYLMNRQIPSEYIWQMQMQMYVTGRKWCDFVYYNPNFSRPILIDRVEADQEKQESIKIGLDKGKELINNILTTYKGGLNA